MNWKFWSSKNEDGQNSRPKVKMQGPKDMPQQVGQYLVIKEKMDPDRVWKLKCLMRQRPEHKARFDFRVFSSNSAANAGVRVANYDTLDAHPELILFHGWYDKHSNQLEINRGQMIKAA